MKQRHQKARKKPTTSWLTYACMLIGIMLLSFLAARHFGAHFDWESASSPSVKSDMLRRVDMASNKQALSTSNHFVEKEILLPQLERINPATIDRSVSTQQSGYVDKLVENAEMTTVSNVGTTLTTGIDKVSPVYPTELEEKEVSTNNMEDMMKHHGDTVTSEKTTLLDISSVSSSFVSSIQWREGYVWRSGVRPGCVYWWCYSHPQSPAPIGYKAKRSPAQQLLVDESWLNKMRQRYPDHANKFHANRSVYYSEPKDHFDLTYVGISDNTFHIFNPDTETRKLLDDKLNKYELEKSQKQHADQQQAKKNKKNSNSKLQHQSSSSSSLNSKLDYQLPCYESVDIRAKKDMGLKQNLCPKLKMHEVDSSSKSGGGGLTMKIAQDKCEDGVFKDETLFFLAPHYPGNFFHIMNDNLIPLITDIQSTPGCDSDALTCKAKASLAQFWFNPDRVAGGANKWWDVLLPSLFQPIIDANELISKKGKMKCYRRVSWGLGPRPFYTDFVEARVDALQALRRHALNIHQVEDKDVPRERSAGSDRKGELVPTSLKVPLFDTMIGGSGATSWQQPRDFSSSSPKVVFIRRYKKTKEQNPRGGGITYNRVLGDPEELVDAFRSLGVPIVECCDFSAGIKDMLKVVSDADVVMSLHGAGLINGIFAKSGMILVELHGGYGADDVIFRRLSQGRRGGYVKVRAEEKTDAHYIGRERAEVVAKCVMSLLKNERCDSFAHTDLEESWRALDM